ncbi:MAG: hypothetical protein H6734_20150 [Alphaproteobacteria bacterium]|nr:hypothetical protein [Alphaproteobacteria bacterium]
MAVRGRSGVLGLVVLFGLGCAGLFDDGSGPEPVTVSYDGNTQTITQGPDVVFPADFPLPPPPGLTPASSIFSDGDGPSTITYKLPSLEIASATVDFYAQWFKDNGIKAEHASQNLAGMKSTTIVAQTKKQTLSVSVMDGLGTRMLTLTVEPR